MEWLLFGFGVLLCVGGLPGLLLGLALGRSSRPSAAPAPRDRKLYLNDMAEQLDAWVAAERLPADVAEEVYALIEADRAAILAPPSVANAPAPAAPLPDATPPPVAAPEPAAAVGSAPARAAPAEHAADLPITSTGPEPTASRHGPAAPPAPPRRRLASALLALGTRRTLLYLGTFLLVLSGVTLVVFNWASFAPPIQTALLAGITAAIWGGGAWMTGRPDLARAGANLQAVAGLLVPVVAFAFTRPGMLDLAPRIGWLFVALACLPIYSVAAWRTRNSFYSVAAGLAGANALLAGLSGVPLNWLPTWLLGLLTIYLFLAQRLKVFGRPDLAAGPYWTAHIGAPLAVVFASALWFAPQVSVEAGAGAGAAVATFYIVAAWLEDRPIWSWAAALFTLIAVYANLFAWFDVPNLPVEAPVMALLAVGGLQVALSLRLRRPRLWFAPFVVALIPAVLALAAAARSTEEARITLPIMIAGGIMLLRAARRGRLDSLAIAPADLDLAGFSIATVLIPFWLGAVLDLAGLAAGWFGLVMLALALPAFAAAYWWPGRLRPAYDVTLQAIGALLVLGSTASLAFAPDVWRQAALLLAVILIGQALLRRQRVWATLALGSALLIGPAFLERSVFAADLTAWQFLGLGYTVLYALGATLLRRRLRAEWLAPALIAAAIVGTVTALLALVILLDGLTAGACLTLVALGGLLIALSRLWLEARLGYPAVGLLMIGALTAAMEGFFTGWAPGGRLAYLILTLAVGFGLAGLMLRRRAPAFALPYELAALVLLLLAPMETGGSPAHLTITWLALTAIYALATERYRLPWFALASWICLDLALLQGIAWRFPALPFAQSGIALAVLAWAQGSLALVLRPAAQANRFRHGLVLCSYVALALSGFGALALAITEPAVLAIVAFTLLALLIVIATLVQSALAAWLTWPLLALGLAGVHSVYELNLTTRLLVATCAALGLAIFGWALSRSPNRATRVWDAPLRLPPLAVGLVSGVLLGGLHLWNEDVAGLSLAFTLWGLFWVVGGLRERQPWAALPAVTAGNLALLSVFILPDEPFPFVLIISVAFTLATIEGGLAAGLRRTARARLGYIGLAIYLAAALMGLSALLLALSTPERIAAVALGLAVLVAVLSSIERQEAGIWGALGLSVLSFFTFGAAQGLNQDWMTAWLPLALIAFGLLGLVLERLGFAFWRRPTTIGVALVGGLALLVQYGNVPALERLQFTQAALALVNLALLWATVAIRMRMLNLGYAAGAAFVGAALCRLADLGVAEPQWYVIPAGLYLLALAAGLRQFQGRRRASQVLELAAALLILGTSFAQALRIPGGPGYELLLFGEALLMVAYGVLLRLRVPFVMGVAFFVAGATWLALEVSRGFNQWVLLGIFGILMIAAYVVLERHQERLVRLGRTWMLELRSWA